MISNVIQIVLYLVKYECIFNHNMRNRPENVQQSEYSKTKGIHSHTHSVYHGVFERREQKNTITLYGVTESQIVTKQTNMFTINRWKRQNMNCTAVFRFFFFFVISSLLVLLLVLFIFYSTFFHLQLIRSQKLIYAY